MCEEIRVIKINNESNHDMIHGGRIRRDASQRLLQLVGDKKFRIVIEGEIKGISGGAFKNLTNLVSIEFQDPGPGREMTIGEGAFSGCTSLTSVKITGNVVSIGNNAFEDCLGLRSIQLPVNCRISRIGKEAFSGCINLSKIGKDLNNIQQGEAIILDHVTTIGEGAFEGCARLASIQLGNSITIIGDGTFEGCTGLTSIQLGGNITGIGKEAFSGCINLSKIGKDLNCIQQGEAIIPDQVMTIGAGAFDGCIRLNSIEMRNVRTIGDEAFSGCSGLTQVKISENTNKIGKYAFSGCIELNRFGQAPESLQTGEARIPVSIVRKKTNGIQRDVSLIEDGAFEGCAGLVSVQIGNVEEIGKDAFVGCTGLKTIDIPDTVSSIGDGAFEDCTGLVSICFQGRVAKIGNNAFSGCTSLTTVNMNHVNEILDGAFNDCQLHDSITTVRRTRGRGEENTLVYLRRDQQDIPEGVVRIGGSVFRNRNDLTNRYIIPDDVKTIGFEAFSGCINLQSVELPPTLTTIEDEAFLGCCALESVIIRNHANNAPARSALETIGNAVFSGCSNLRSFGVLEEDGHANIPTGVTKIGREAFAGCAGLTSISIPESVREIGLGAFDDCPAQIIIAGNKRILHFLVEKDENQLRKTKTILINPEFVKKYGYKENGNGSSVVLNSCDISQILDEMANWMIDNYDVWMRIPYMWPMRRGNPRQGTHFENVTVLDFARYTLYDVVQQDELYDRIKGILKWGGIRNSAPAREYAKAIPVLRNTSVLNFVLRKGKGHDKQNWRVSSWSKVLAAYRPGQYFIYDSRVAIALSYITNELRLPVFWRIPPASDSNGVKRFKDKVNKHLNPDNTHSSRLTIEADIPTCYYLYLELLRRVEQKISNAAVLDPFRANQTHHYGLLGRDREHIPSSEEIEAAYEQVFGTSRRLSIMAHVEKMLFMMKEPIFERYNIAND